MGRLGGRRVILYAGLLTVGDVVVIAAVLILTRQGESAKPTSTQEAQQIARVIGCHQLGSIRTPTSDPTMIGAGALAWLTCSDASHSVIVVFDGPGERDMLLRTVRQEPGADQARVVVGSNWSVMTADALMAAKAVDYGGRDTSP